jgi:hypothetical protein
MNTDAPFPRNFSSDDPPRQTADDLTQALTEMLAGRDLSAALAIYPSPESVAQRMLQAVPDVVVRDPPIGACYSAPALARWKQLSRQAVDQQRKAGRLFGVMVDRRWLYPSVQFDSQGRQSPAFLAVRESRSGKDAVEFAVWLEAPDPETGVAPKAKFQRAADNRTLEERFFDGFVPTIIQPPFAPVNAGPDK